MGAGGSMIKPVFILIVMIIAQIFIPAAMIQRYESTFQNGSLYKFEVAPVDPVDPFKGRYVRLNFPIANWNVKYQSEDKFKRKDKIYATLKINSEGYAVIDQLYKSLPKDSDQEYLKVTVRSVYNKYSQAELASYSISLPFDRYYAKETKAPEIERRVMNQDRNTGELTIPNTSTSSNTPTSSVDVRVLNGFGVIEQLYIEGKAVEEFFDR